ncbi:MAG: hypothetical protein WAZ15_02075 [Propioniciclava sp.]
MLSMVGRARALILVVGLAAGAACTPITFQTQIAPTQAQRCVPEAGGEAVPCGPVEFEASQRRDALYAEAESVYRRYWAELRRIEVLEYPKVTSELEAVVGGQFRDVVAQLVTKLGFTQRLSGDSPIVWVKRWVGPQRSDSLVSLEACTDERGSQFKNPDGGEALAGRAIQRRVYFSREGDEAPLRIIESEYKRVEQY